MKMSGDIIKTYHQKFYKLGISEKKMLVFRKIFVRTKWMIPK